MLGSEGYCDSGRTDNRPPVANIHGAINLETGQRQMLEVAKVNARSLIALLKAVEAAHPQKRWIHVHLDNASYHHAKRVRKWLKRQGRKCVLHFIPPYRPHLDPIERCWELMNQYTTHNRDYKTLSCHWDAASDDLGSCPQDNGQETAGSRTSAADAFRAALLLKPGQISSFAVIRGTVQKPEERPCRALPPISATCSPNDR